MSRTPDARNEGLGGRIAVAFGGAALGFATGLLLFLLINEVALNFQAKAAVDSENWALLPFRWVWWSTGASAVFAFLAPETFVDVIGAVWQAIYGVISGWAAAVRERDRWPF